MSAVLVQVADAVVELLNTPGAFSQTFLATWNFAQWKVPLEKLCKLRVDVVPVGHPVSDLDTRVASTYDLRLLVVIREKFGQSDREEEGKDGRPISREAIAENVLLVEQIHEYLFDRDRRALSVDDVVIAKWKETRILNTYIDTHLRDNSQFTGIIRLTYHT